ncbi:efflux RND transporter periplasmic adaptor subunit [Acinetobacter populi]|nr:efflux RND transporter periplasmic adaptor subunit [Acinetobacter populi]
MITISACSGEQKAAPEKTVAEVGVEVLQPQSIEVQQTLAGRSTAYLSSDVRPQVSGIIKQRLFNEGDYVKAGQPLYKLDDKLFVAAYESAKGDLQKAQAALISAQPKAQHYRNLLKIEAVSKQDVADAESSLKEYQAAVTSAQAALNTAKINLDYTVIRAPISGQIATSTYTPGALVTAEQTTALTTIQQLNPIYVDITLSSSELLSLKKQMDNGQLQAISKIPVDIILEDGSTYNQKGQLQFIGSSVDTGTGDVKLRALVPNANNLLLPGMYVKAKLPMAVNHQAVLVPQSAVTRNHKGDAVVKLVNAQNKVVEQVIETSGTQNNYWIVSKGIQSGDQLIIDGASQVSSGDSVKISAKQNQNTVAANTTTQTTTQNSDKE